MENAMSIICSIKRCREKDFNLPYKVLAMAAECGLFEETWHKAMILNHVHIFLLECSFPAP